MSPEPRIRYLSRRQMMSRPMKQRLNPVYVKACDFFNAVLIDRTGTIDAGIEFQIIDPIHRISGSSDPFSTICLDRARQIALSSRDKTITLLWSGGIDSTTALVSLILALGESDELHRLKVLLSQESINEFPSFFNEKIKPALTYVVMKDGIYTEIRRDEYNVSGEHGDQLFGSDKLQYAVQTGDAFRPFEDILEFIIARKLGTSRYTQAIIDFFSAQIQHSQVRIHTLYDYLWWMNFSMKWQNVTMRLIHGLGEDRFVLDHNLTHFFQSLPFQNWSVSNHDNKIKTDWRSYKYAAKEFIYQFHADKNYLVNKEKEQSLKQVIVHSNDDRKWYNAFTRWYKR